MCALKVCVLSHDLAGGGGHIRAYLLGEALARLGCHVRIIGFLVFGDRVFAQPPEGLELVSFPGRNYPQFLIPAAQALSRLDADVVYAVKARSSTFGLALVNRLLRRVPVILDIDDWDMALAGGVQRRYRPRPKQFIKDLLWTKYGLRYPHHLVYIRQLEKLIPLADQITVNNRFLESRFGGTYVPSGKDTALFDPARFEADECRAKLGLSAYRVLMFPGSPRPQKGLEDLLAALELINEPDIRLVIVGGGKYDDYDSELARRWGRWIINLPPVAVSSMPEIVAAAHVVVVPSSDTEISRAQFPLKLTDGMSMAKPVLATTVGDIPEILADCGYLVPPGSPERLGQAIKHILSDPAEAAATGARARERCLKYYTIEAMSQALSGVLGKLGLPVT